MILTVASGKGGTGKTTFAVNLAYALARRGENVRLLDCDVEEPNDHLFVKPDFALESDVTVLKPVWDQEKCTGCGRCTEACNYNAIALVKGKVLIFSELCRSCGACTYVCPEEALREESVTVGKVQATPRHEPFFFAHGLLNIGESLAPRVVQAVKTHISSQAVNILDASPGTACPVVKALEGADVAVLLTEPTPFGLNDLKLAAAMALGLGIPTGVVVNRSNGEDRIIADWADSVGVPIVGRIPFERKYAETYSTGDILVEWHPELVANLLDIYKTLRELRGTTVAAAPKMETAEVTAGDVAPFPKGHATDYREITIISGKGGTGKTTVTGSSRTTRFWPTTMWTPQICIYCSCRAFGNPIRSWAEQGLRWIPACVSAAGNVPTPAVSVHSGLTDPLAVLSTKPGGWILLPVKAVVFARWFVRQMPFARKTRSRVIGTFPKPTTDRWSMPAWGLPRKTRGASSRRYATGLARWLPSSAPDGFWEMGLPEPGVP